MSDCLSLSLSLSLKTLDSENEEIIVIGDLNCNYLSQNKTSQMRQLIEISEVFQLSQIIDQPTRITATSKTLIDVFITNNLSRVVTKGVVDWGASDHRLVYFVRKLAVPSKNGHKYVSSRSFKIFHPDSFSQDLEAVPWESINSLESPEMMWNTWKHLFTYNISYLVI